MPTLGMELGPPWRATAEAWRRAFMAALTQLSGPSGNGHMKAALDAHRATLADDDPLALAVDTVTIFQRWHPDMEAFGAALGIDTDHLDTIMRLAMAIESQASQAELAAIIATWTPPPAS